MVQLFHLPSSSNIVTNTSRESTNGIGAETIIRTKSSSASNIPSSNIEIVNEVVVTPAVNVTMYGPVS